jgi:hypothetical protein
MLYCKVKQEFNNLKMMFLVEISTAVTTQLPLLLPVKKILHLGLRWDGPSLQPPVLGGGGGGGGGGREGGESVDYQPTGHSASGMWPGVPDAPKYRGEGRGGE